MYLILCGVQKTKTSLITNTFIFSHITKSLRGEEQDTSFPRVTSGSAGANAMKNWCIAKIYDPLHGTSTSAARIMSSKSETKEIGQVE